MQNGQLFALHAGTTKPNYTWTSLSRTHLSRTTHYLEQIPISARFPVGLIIVIPSPDISNSRYVEQIFISRASST